MKDLFYELGRMNHYYQTMKDKKEYEKYTLASLEKIKSIIDNYFPHGSGIDSKCIYNKNLSNPEKIVVNFEFHFMNSNGFYTYWKDYKAIITANKNMTDKFNLKIIGENYQNIKDYLHDVFYFCLFDTEIPEEKEEV